MNYDARVDFEFYKKKMFKNSGLIFCRLHRITKEYLLVAEEVEEGVLLSAVKGT